MTLRTTECKDCGMTYSFFFEKQYHKADCPSIVGGARKAEPMTSVSNYQYDLSGEVWPYVHCVECARQHTDTEPCPLRIASYVRTLIVEMLSTSVRPFICEGGMTKADTRYLEYITNLRASESGAHGLAETLDTELFNTDFIEDVLANMLQNPFGESKTGLADFNREES